MKSYFVLLALFGVFATSPVLAADDEDDGSLDLKEGATGGEDALVVSLGSDVSVRHIFPPKCPNTYDIYPTKQCPRSKKCDILYCKNIIEYGYSKCERIPVALKNPIYHTAIRCKKEKDSCAKGYTTDACFCKTIYCRRLIWRYVVILGKTYRMQVYVKYPCNCRCATYKRY